MYLQRYHDVAVSPSGVWRILKRLDLNRLPSSQRYKRHDRRWKRYEKQLPGNRLQVDVKFIEPIGGGARSTTSSPPSTTALASGFCGSTPQQTRRPPSSSSTTSSRSSPWRRVHPDRQRRRVPRGVPLARPGPRIGHVYIKPKTPRLNGQGRAITPHRQRGVLSTPRRRRHRRRKLFTRSSRSGRTSTTPRPTAVSMDNPLRTTRQRTTTPAA